MQSSMARITQEKSGSGFDDFCRIEELIKGNTFSRLEVSNLVEILDSRLEKQLEKPKSSTDAAGVEETQLVSVDHGIQRTQPIDRNAIGTSREKAQVGASASPIDIARAYMAGRSSEGIRVFDNTNSNGETAQLGNEFSRKPSVCWPGAMVHEQHNGYTYTTPQSERGRARQRLHDYPKTPYSRIMLPKSNTKLQIESAYANTSTPFEQSQSSIYGQAKSSDNIFDDYGSVGPIRRMKNKYSPQVQPRAGSIFSPTQKNKSPEMAKPAAFGGFLELGETSGAASKYSSRDNNTSVFSPDGHITNRQSPHSDTVRKILEHLERNKATPKEKEAELRLVTAWRRSPPEATDSTSHDGKISSARAQEFSTNSCKSSLFVNSAEDDKGVNEAKAAANSFGYAGPNIRPGVNSMPSFGLKKAIAPSNRGDDAKMATGTSNSQILKNNGKRPPLPLISISKPVLPSVSASEELPGFTFPVSTSSGLLSEPQTPSIIPASSDLHTIPSYTFGTKRSASLLVFSFSSIGTSNQESCDMKFTFGSKEKDRLCFSFGRGAACY